MITHTSPSEYHNRPAPRLPQKVKVCLACGGTCVDLPMIGVACLQCKGKCFAIVPQDRWIEVRNLIVVGVHS